MQLKVCRQRTAKRTVRCDFVYPVSDSEPHSDIFYVYLAISFFVCIQNYLLWHDEFILAILRIFGITCPSVPQRRHQLERVSTPFEATRCITPLRRRSLDFASNVGHCPFTGNLSSVLPEICEKVCRLSTFGSLCSVSILKVCNAPWVCVGRTCTKNLRTGFWGCDFKISRKSLFFSSKFVFILRGFFLFLSQEDEDGTCQ